MSAGGPGMFAGWQNGLGAVVAVLGGALAVGVVVAAVASGPGERPRATLPAAAAGPTQEVLGSTAGPAGSALPTELQSPSPSARAEPSPVPSATPRPVRTPKPDGPASQRPAEVVLAFYVAVATHDWATATALWSPDMQARNPPDEAIVDRFSATQRIQINLIQTVNRSGDTARVEVTFVEYRTVAPSPQQFAGAWDLVRIDGQWLLDNTDL